MFGADRLVYFLFCSIIDFLYFGGCFGAAAVLFSINLFAFLLCLCLFIFALSERLFARAA